MPLETLKETITIANEGIGEVTFSGLPEGAKLRYIIFESDTVLNADFEYIKHIVSSKSEGATEGALGKGGQIMWDTVYAELSTSGAYIAHTRYKYDLDGEPVKRDRQNRLTNIYAQVVNFSGAQAKWVIRLKYYPK